MTNENAPIIVIEKNNNKVIFSYMAFDKFKEYHDDYEKAGKNLMVLSDIEGNTHYLNIKRIIDVYPLTANALKEIQESEVVKEKDDNEIDLSTDQDA